MKYIIIIMVLGILNYASLALAVFSPKNGNRVEMSGSTRTAGYIKAIKKAIIKNLKGSTSSKTVKISNILFIEEDIKTVAGQEQVTLSFTYEVAYTAEDIHSIKGNKVKKQGRILLAKDENGNWFDNLLEI